MLFILTPVRHNTVSHNILIDKLMKYELGKWTVRWTERPGPRGSDHWHKVQLKAGYLRCTPGFVVCASTVKHL